MLPASVACTSVLPNWVCLRLASEPRVWRNTTPETFPFIKGDHSNAQIIISVISTSVLYVSNWTLRKFRFSRTKISFWLDFFCKNGLNWWGRTYKILNTFWTFFFETIARCIVQLRNNTKKSCMYVFSEKITVLGSLITHYICLAYASSPPHIKKSV
jgi:hypothetical protein